MNRLLTALVLLMAWPLCCMGAEQIVPSRNELYVNSRVKSDAAKWTFATAREALRAAESISQEKRERGDTTWTVVYIEPSVYWIDDPQSPETVHPLPGETTPFGMKLRMDRVRIVGLTDNPKEVILACQRGQTQGAEGNFTMLHIEGSDIAVENLTLGNYCNVDLVYDLDPKLSRPRRADAIVQAQLVICDCDRYRAKNLCPFAGARSVVFDDCYFECTDDALCGTGTYQHCRFTFFSSKPFYSTSGQGAFFYDCDIHCKTLGTQYLTKVSSPVQLHNCRITSDDPNLRVAWTRKPNPKDKCCMSGCTLNGQPLEVPPTPDVPMPVGFRAPVTDAQGWELSAYCPSDLGAYAFEPDTLSPAWMYGEGMDGAEGCYGLMQNVRGARMMYAGREGEQYGGQRLTLHLDPCKSAGQGFGSATGQYLDVCIKFDASTLSGYGIRFVRTPQYDRAVEVLLVRYADGAITPITGAEKCVLFRRGCRLELIATASTLTAHITNGTQQQTLTAPIAPNPYGGIHLQHTGSAGANATVVSAIHAEYLE
ncbi:MAG: hypothetical protein Q4B58_03780 [Bacteroidales bacterium]|nr:hypothetical protein [Bacteroidales bacterium]